LKSYSRKEVIVDTDKEIEKLKGLNVEIRNGHIYEKLHCLLFGENAQFSLVNLMSIYKAQLCFRGEQRGALLWIFRADSDKEAAEKVAEKLKNIRKNNKVGVDNPGAYHEIYCSSIECMSLVRNVRDLSLYMWDYQLESKGEVMIDKS
jgi:hypothetical protein